MRVVRTRLARRDILEHYRWFAHRSPSTAERFLESLEVTSRLLAENPKIAAIYPGSEADVPGLRRWPVSGFDNYLIFFREEEGDLSITRVLHAAQDILSLLKQNS